MVMGMDWITRHERNLVIIDKYKAGYTGREIADQLGMKVPTVFNVLHGAQKHGLVTMRKPGNTRRLNRNSNAETVALRMRNAGHTYQTIGDELGVSRQRIHQIVSRAQQEARRG